MINNIYGLVRSYNASKRVAEDQACTLHEYGHGFPSAFVNSGKPFQSFEKIISICDEIIC